MIREFRCPLPNPDHDTVTLAHGGGGRASAELLASMLLPALANPLLDELHDGAVLPPSDHELAFSTDSFVVRPLFFPGGDIGRLAVHGTTNDLAMCGARPRWMSLGLILEEGLPLADLRRILESIRDACRESDVVVVTGDTKVVERGHGDGVFVNTTGIGEVVPGARVRPSRVRPGDRILVNGPIAEHGIAILTRRENLQLEGDLRSDSAALWPLVEALLDRLGEDLHCLRDATRGGIASATNEIAAAAHVGMVIEETAVPLRAPVRAACEIFGLDPLYVANEGRLLAFVPAERAGAAVECLRAHPMGEDAAIIGEVVEGRPGRVVVRGGLGTDRVLDMLRGEQLPRIC